MTELEKERERRQEMARMAQRAAQSEENAWKKHHALRLALEAAYQQLVHLPECNWNARQRQCTCAVGIAENALGIKKSDQGARGKCSEPNQRLVK